MKRSIGFRAQPGFATSGTAGLLGRDERPVRLARGHSRLLAGDRLGPLVDPVFEQLDLGLGQRRPLQGHAFGRPFAPHGGDERALLASAGNDDRPALAPLERRRGRIEPQPAPRLDRPVTRHAVPGQDRLDLTGVINRRSATPVWVARQRRCRQPTRAMRPAPAPVGPPSTAPRVRRWAGTIRGIVGEGREGNQIAKSAARNGITAASSAGTHWLSITIPQATQPRQRIPVNSRRLT